MGMMNAVRLLRTFSNSQRIYLQPTITKLANQSSSCLSTTPPSSNKKKLSNLKKYLQNIYKNRPSIRTILSWYIMNDYIFGFALVFLGSLYYYYKHNSWPHQWIFKKTATKELDT